MKTLRDRIQALTKQNLQQLTKDYEKFERDGEIGDFYLRSTADDFLSGGPLTLGVQISPVLWMERIAFEAYRELCHRVDIPYLPSNYMNLDGETHTS